jgi:chaperonin GroEL (HSP60 family)
MPEKKDRSSWMKFDHILRETTDMMQKMMKYKDLVKAGIIDPTKVERCARENAISIAGMFLTTEALIVENPKKEEPSMPQGGGMGGMGGMGMY